MIGQSIERVERHRSGSLLPLASASEHRHGVIPGREGWDGVRRRIQRQSLRSAAGVQPGRVLSVQGDQSRTRRHGALSGVPALVDAKVMFRPFLPARRWPAPVAPAARSMPPAADAFLVYCVLTRYHFLRW